MPEIKPPRPCICGATAALIKHGKTWQIGCTNPKCALIVYGFKTQAEVKKAWEEKLQDIRFKEIQAEKQKSRGGKRRGN